MGKITRISPQKDELIVAELEKYKAIKVEKRDISIRQWPYKPGLVLSAKLVDAAKSLATNSKGKKVDIEDFLKMDITKFISNFTELGTEALQWGIDSKRSGFESSEDCRHWQDDLSMTEMVRVFTEIVKLNIRPLVSALGELKTIATSLPKSRQAPAPTS